MTKLSPAVIAAVFLVYVIPLQAQVKDTYQDQSNALTTIVVKEDSASDMAILQQQFDLDEIGMHQVIRITTRPNAAPKLEESKIDSPAIAEKSSMIAQAEPNTTPKEAPVLASPAPTPLEVTKEEAKENSSPSLPATPKGEAVTQKSQRSSSSSSGTSTRSKNSQKQTKASNKRFKKEKRSRVSKRSHRKARCYKF